MLNTITKYALRGMAILFALSAMTSIVIAHDAGIMAAVFSLAIAAGLWYWSGKSDRAQQRFEALCQEANNYLNHVNSARSFPESKTSRIIARADNPVLAACDARLLELTSDGARQYLGTRIKIGNVPIYLGQSGSRTKRLTETAAGELAITARELIFNGQSRSVDIDLDKITAVDLAIDGFHVAVKGRQKPFIFVVSNGLLWGTLVRQLASIKIDGRKLPDGVTLALE